MYLKSKVHTSNGSIIIIFLKIIWVVVHILFTIISLDFVSVVLYFSLDLTVSSEIGCCLTSCVRLYALYLYLYTTKIGYQS